MHSPVVHQTLQQIVCADCNMIIDAAVRLCCRQHWRHDKPGMGGAAARAAGLARLAAAVLGL